MQASRRISKVLFAWGFACLGIWVFGGVYGGSKKTDEASPRLGEFFLGEFPEAPTM